MQKFEDIRNQQKATAKQIAVYNALAKTYNAQPKAQRVIPANDLKQLETIYRLMSDNQKAESLPFPECNLTSEQELPIMVILINRNDELLVDDELGTLESIDNKLKKLAKEGESGRVVLIKHDTETSKEIISKVEALVKANKFKVASFDLSKIPPPPPPPPLPAPKKAKGGPNAQEIQPIEILIDKDEIIELNGKKIEINDINNEVKKLNQHLSNDEHRKYVMASIILEKNKSLDIAKTIQKKLREVEVWSSCMSYNENKSKSNLPSNHFNLYSGLTLEEAKAKEKEILSEPIKIDTSKNSPWKIKTGVASYKYIDNNGDTTTDEILPPPPPAAETTLDFVIRMAKNNAKFFSEGKSISSDKAIDLIKKNDKLNINAQKTETKEPLIYISKQPILIGVNGKVGEQMSINVMVNGKTLESFELKMTRTEFKNIKLSTKNGKVTAFKFKIPGNPTQSLKGHTIDLKTVKNIKAINKDDHLVIFDIKDGSDIKIEPLVIIITD